jgi:hypothetical protein
MHRLPYNRRLTPPVHLVDMLPPSDVMSVRLVIAVEFNKPRKECPAKS